MHVAKYWHPSELVGACRPLAIVSNIMPLVLVLFVTWVVQTDSIKLPHKVPEPPENKSWTFDGLPKCIRDDFNTIKCCIWLLWAPECVSPRRACACLQLLSDSVAWLHSGDLLYWCRVAECARWKPPVKDWHVGTTPRRVSPSSVTFLSISLSIMPCTLYFSSPHPHPFSPVSFPRDASFLLDRLVRSHLGLLKHLFFRPVFSAFL